MYSTRTVAAAGTCCLPNKITVQQADTATAVLPYYGNSVSMGYCMNAIDIKAHISATVLYVIFMIVSVKLDHEWFSCGFHFCHGPMLTECSLQYGPHSTVATGRRIKQFFIEYNCFNTESPRIVSATLHTLCLYCKVQTVTKANMMMYHS